MIKGCFIKILYCFLLLTPLCSYAQRNNKSDEQWARQLIHNALNDKKHKMILINKVIPDKKTAINVAEQILFNIYGKSQIEGEKPYKVQLVDGYWVLNGTLKPNYVGGTFLIVFSAKDGRVIVLTHGK